MSDNFNEKCVVCGTSPAFFSHYTSHHRFCMKHEKYYPVYYFEIIQLRLGIITALPAKFHSCEICNEALTPEQIKTIDPCQSMVVCNKHMAAAYWVNPVIAKQWFVFKETVKQSAMWEDDDDKKHFLKWRKKP